MSIYYLKVHIVPVWERKGWDQSQSAESQRSHWLAVSMSNCYIKTLPGINFLTCETEAQIRSLKCKLHQGQQVPGTQHCVSTSQHSLLPLQELWKQAKHQEHSHQTTKTAPGPPSLPCPPSQHSPQSPGSRSPGKDGLHHLTAQAVVRGTILR